MVKKHIFKEFQRYAFDLCKIKEIHIKMKINNKTKEYKDDCVGLKL